MATRRHHRVGEVARLTGVSVRALHHYDQIGLLVPSHRSASGYRCYDDRDLLRLQQIVIGRELGLSLDEIGRSLDDPSFDVRASLRAQRALLVERAAQAAAMIRAIDAALEATGPTDGDTMATRQMFEGFDTKALDDEAKQRWGEGEAYGTSKRRTAAYGPAEWAEIKASWGEIYGALAAAMREGQQPDGERAQQLVERHRQHIDRWFYPCSVEMHRNLADLYENDARFAATIDAHGEGLTAFFVAAIRAAGAR